MHAVPSHAPFSMLRAGYERAVPGSRAEASQQALPLTALWFEAGALPVDIEPRFQADAVPLGGGPGGLGPFQHMVPTPVPIWTARLLRDRCLCSVVAPSWLQTRQLEALLAGERVAARLTPLPSHFFLQVSLVAPLLDTPEAARTALAAADKLWARRQNKLITFLRTDFFRRPVNRLSLFLEHVTPLELYMLRPAMRAYAAQLTAFSALTARRAASAAAASTTPERTTSVVAPLTTPHPTAQANPGAQTPGSGTDPSSFIRSGPPLMPPVP